MFCDFFFRVFLCVCVSPTDMFSQESGILKDTLMWNFTRIILSFDLCKTSGAVLEGSFEWQLTPTGNLFLCK